MEESPLYKEKCRQSLVYEVSHAHSSALNIYTGILSTEDKHLPSSLNMSQISRLVVICHVHDKDLQDDFSAACLNPAIYRVKAYPGTRWKISFKLHFDQANAKAQELQGFSFYVSRNIYLETPLLQPSMTVHLLASLSMDPF